MKKSIVIIMVTMILGSTVAGCSSKVERRLKKDNTQSSTSNKEEAIKIVLWNSSLDEEKYSSVVMEEFNKLGNNIELEFKQLPEGAPAELSQKLVTELIGGSQINIFDVNQAEYFQMASKGLYEPLNSYIERDSFEPNILGAGNIEISDIDGELYALPYMQSKFVMYYNKDMFDKAGIEYPTNDWTWDQFRQVAKKLTKGEGIDRKLGVAMPWYPCTWTGIASQTGVEMISDGKANFDNPVFRDALQFKYDLTMVDKSMATVAEGKTTKAHWSKDFSAGNVGMMIAPDFAIGTLAQNVEGNYPFEYDMAYIPHPEGVEAGTTFGSPRYIGINAKAKPEEKEAAWEVLKFLASSETVAKLLSDGGGTPALLTEEVSEYHLANAPEFVQNEGIIFDDNERVEEKASHIISNQIEQILVEEGELALTDAKSVEEALATIQKRVTEELVKASE